MTALCRTLALLLSLVLVLVGTSCVSANRPGKVTHLLQGNDLTPFYSYLQGLGRDTDPDGVFIDISEGY